VFAHLLDCHELPCQICAQHSRVDLITDV
jgi:hypothetical protein